MERGLHEESMHFLDEENRAMLDRNDDTGHEVILSNGSMLDPVDSTCYGNKSIELVYFPLLQKGWCPVLEEQQEVTHLEFFRLKESTHTNASRVRFPLDKNQKSRKGGRSTLRHIPVFNRNRKRKTQSRMLKEEEKVVSTIPEYVDSRSAVLPDSVPSLKPSGAKEQENCDQSRKTEALSEYLERSSRVGVELLQEPRVVYSCETDSSTFPGGDCYLIEQCLSAQSFVQDEIRFQPPASACFDIRPNELSLTKLIQPALSDLTECTESEASASNSEYRFDGNKIEETPEDLSPRADAGFFSQSNDSKLQSENDRQMISMSSSISSFANQFIPIEFVRLFSDLSTNLVDESLACK